jgi:hypothetical protein
MSQPYPWAHDQGKGLQRCMPSVKAGNVGDCEGMNPTLPSELPLCKLESRWIPESLESDFRRQNPLDRRVPYIIENLLELKCLKWARMTHLDI